MSHLACGDAQGHFMNQHQLDMFIFLKERLLSQTAGKLIGI